MLIPNAAPPACDEKQPGGAPVQQQGGQLPQAQYTQVQLVGVYFRVKLHFGPPHRATQYVSH